MTTAANIIGATPHIPESSSCLVDRVVVLINLLEEEYEYEYVLTTAARGSHADSFGKRGMLAAIPTLYLMHHCTVIMQRMPMVALRCYPISSGL